MPEAVADALTTQNNHYATAADASPNWKPFTRYVERQPASVGGNCQMKDLFLPVE